MHSKDFEGWSKVKQKIHATQRENLPTFKECEIWWCSIGVNIGDEEDGKNATYHRPVLIIKKFNSRLFWGVPTTTKLKDSPFYFPVEFKGKKQSVISVMLTHLRLYDSRRLQNIAGKMSDKQFDAIKQAIKNLL